MTWFRTAIIVLAVAGCFMSGVAAEFDLRVFGARPDGSKCTHAFAAAMAACEKAGGGRIVVPEGKWFSGAIRFRNNCELHLAEGSEVVFSQDPQDYLPAVCTSWEGMECWNYCPLVYAYGCTNVAITGRGTLRAFEGDWKNALWCDWEPQTNGVRAARLQLYTWGATGEPVENRQIWKMKNAHTRPHFIQFNRCKNVRWEDFKIRNSPFWTLHLYLCERATIRRLDVFAHGANNDGIDIEMSREVLVENCTFDQGDDGVVIKAGRNRDGWRLATPTENVLIRNCRIVNAHSLFCIGSEISGGVRNVRMEDCTGGDVQRAVYVKTNRRRGGFVEDVRAQRISVEKTRVAILAIETDVLYEWADFPDYELRTTSISGICLKDVSCGATARRVMIDGDPSKIVEDVSLENVCAESVLNGEHLANVGSFKDVRPRRISDF